MWAHFESTKVKAVESNESPINTDSLEDLKTYVDRFCEARDWDQFHTPKDLAIGLVTEAAELVDLFRFKSEAQALDLLETKKSRLKLEQEMADCLFFILRMSSRWDINLGEVLLQKMKLNDQKYPVEKYKGRNQKYNEE